MSGDERAPGYGDLPARDLLKKAHAHHRAGRLDKAQRLYRKVLTQQPENGDALHLLGVVATQLGNFDEAVRLIGDAIRLRPAFAQAHYNLGIALKGLDRLDEAAAGFRRAIEIEPGYTAALINLGTTLTAQGDRDRAIASFERAVECGPDSAEAHFNLGNALQETGRLEEEIVCYRRALTINPGLVEARINLGMALRQQGKPEEAEAELRQAIGLDPENAPARTRLGLVLLEQGRIDEASEAILAPARKFRAIGPRDGAQDTFTKTNRTKLQSDLEQLELLLGRRILGQEYAGLVEEYRGLLAKCPAAGEGTLFDFPAAPSERLSATYNRMIHHAPVAALAAGALNPALDRAAIEADFHGNPPGLTYFDGVLTDEALEGLRRFCMESTVWHQMQFPGELSTSLPNGFCCPLLLQIAQEIRQAFPGIFGDHRLTTFWAYKYFESASGLELHADRGAVSLNLWITPDAANRDPDTGGLTLWDCTAPNAYFLTPREKQVGMLREIVGEPGARPVTVPYRCNRAALFNSNVIHRTEDLRFKDGIENRRINVTFIYGYPRQ